MDPILATKIEPTTVKYFEDILQLNFIASNIIATKYLGNVLTYLNISFSQLIKHIFTNFLHNFCCLIYEYQFR